MQDARRYKKGAVTQTKYKSTKNTSETNMRQNDLFEIFDLKNKIIIPNKELDSKLAHLINTTSEKHHKVLKEAYNILKEPILRKEYREKGDSSMEINSVLNWKQIDELVEELKGNGQPSPQVPAPPPPTPPDDMRIEYENQPPTEPNLNTQNNTNLPKFHELESIGPIETYGSYQLVAVNQEPHQLHQLQLQQPQPQYHNQSGTIGTNGLVTSILKHRVRCRNNTMEIKFLAIRQGLEIIEPKWERMETMIEAGQRCLMGYLTSLLKQHKRQFQNVMLKFTELRHFYMSNINKENQ